MLTPETWDDFATLVEANNGVWGGCWCMGFHPEGVGAGHTPEGNREAKRRHVTRGTVHQVLVYDGDRCVGWCQFGSPPELPNIKNRRTYEQGGDDPPDWRIGCVFTNARDRGSGVAAAAVAAALGEIRRSGGGVVEAYPEQTEQRPPQRGAYLHTGPEELYARYGFTRVRRIAKWRWGHAHDDLIRFISIVERTQGPKWTLPVPPLCVAVWLRRPAPRGTRRSRCEPVPSPGVVASSRPRPVGRG
jgi:hypothetical protein